MSEDSRWGGGRGPYIRAFSGRRIHLDDPEHHEFHLPDVAHHLARIHRYTGASEYSVAQHMVVGAFLARWYFRDTPLLDSRFLLHDIAEFCLGDVSSPLKSLVPDYRRLETRWDTAVETWAWLTFVGIPEVKTLDDRMWLTERQVVYRNVDPEFAADMADDVSRIELKPIPVSEWELEALFRAWPADEAESTYLKAFRAAFPGVG